MTKIPTSEQVLNIVFAFDSKDSRRQDVRELASKVKLLEDTLDDIASNYDCDADAHKYNTHCRCCIAKEALEQSAIIVK